MANCGSDFIGIQTRGLPCEPMAPPFEPGATSGRVFSCYTRKFVDDSGKIEHEKFPFFRRVDLAGFEPAAFTLRT
jgi:hypothetical protein